MTAAPAVGLSERFAAETGRPPVGVWMAPGRVNLIGEHTDYNDGFVLPFAIEQGVFVAVGNRSGRQVVVRSSRFGTFSFAPGDALDRAHWGIYVRAAFAIAATEQMAAGGLEVMIEDDLPMGAGLASSAATLCAVLAAVSEVAESPLRGADLARLARRAEVEVVGVPVGPMDHLASACASPGHGLFLDCRDLRFEQVPLDPGRAGLTLLVTDTSTRHRLVEGEYAARRESCRRAAAALGVPALRDATLEQMASAPEIGPVDARRARHVITEDARVQSAVGLLREERWAEVGALLDESHRSLAADFEVSTAALDLAAEAARRAGALGSRLTGAGFGGSTISLVPTMQVEEVQAVVADAFAEAGLEAPSFLPVVPSAGASRLL